jgi:hypothetical protein
MVKEEKKGRKQAVPILQLEGKATTANNHSYVRKTFECLQRIGENYSNCIE